MMCLDDGEGAEADVWYERRRRARKRWRCCECGAPIPVGCEYIRVTYLADDHWSGGRQHIECLEMWLLVQKDLCGGGLRYLGGLEDELREYEPGYGDEEDPDINDQTKEQRAECGISLMDLFVTVRGVYEAMGAAG